MSVERPAITRPSALRAWRLFICLAVLSNSASGGGPATGPFDRAIEIARPRVVKLYGAGMGRQKAYGSGVLVSPDGRIVTATSLMLEGRSLRAVLADGSSYAAELIARDPYRQLALLKIDVRDLPYFDVTRDSHVRTGDWVIAAANPFKVASGREPVSVAAGIIAARTRLAARHRRQDFSYDGEVLLTDVVVSAPGAAGGALVDARGNLVGVIGRPVVSTRTNTWVNYALPVAEVATFVLAPDAVEARTRPDPTAERAAAEKRLLQLGLRLLDVGGRVRPPYVERVRAASAAHTAGLRANDLILAINDESVATCNDVRTALQALEPQTPLSLFVKRADDVVLIELASAGES